ncbi:DsrE family protein [Flavimaricola marinus]|uniref:DsrE/DsrF-like family protein n=1 Tax=Flavimaricola marinus TaxID=1819565 RepID=A0A238LGQ5_9RHOB|nr:DsrE family protein [Flavimaricola marinus]SMY08917.1 DsrE/DsrF-like family protein [Flavimaricola marinus]
MKSIILAAAIVLSATTSFAEGMTHRVAIHVDENDPQVMNMALNNVANLTSYYEAQGDDVIVELVAYGPGLNMFVAETSPVAERIAAMSLAMPNLKFSGCGNTLSAMEARTDHTVELVSEAEIVPSGVVQLITLQEAGYAYVRP